MTKFFIALILDNKNFITKNNFLARLNNEEAKKLASTHGIRLCCSGLGSSVYEKSGFSKKRAKIRHLRSKSNNYEELFR